VPAFDVTPSSLDSLAAGVGAVQRELDATPDLVGDCSAALGSAVVSSALSSFVAGWRHGRRQISTEVGALASMIAQAAREYSETETSLCAAIPVGAS
jgi:hypothetical protein